MFMKWNFKMKHENAESVWSWTELGTVTKLTTMLRRANFQTQFY